jgi:glyoxylase-like metal-dependent hydrolase (beta-lactamase superfamily II)
VSRPATTPARSPYAGRIRLSAILLALVAGACGAQATSQGAPASSAANTTAASGSAARHVAPAAEAGPATSPGASGEPYLDMPEIAPIGVRIGKYRDVPESARGPEIDPAKGYRVQALGTGLYMVTDNVYQSMFMVYEGGVVVVDAPPSLGSSIPKAIAEITSKPITHIVYSHAHNDHIGAAKGLGGTPVIVAHEETKRLLARANDPNRPLPTRTFTDRYTLQVGSQVLELSYHGNAHEPGNIFIFAPAQNTLMVVDVVFPGWMMWRRLALAQDVPGYFDQVEEIRKLPFETLVSGHVARTGTHADVEMQSAFLHDLKEAAAQGLTSTKLAEQMDRRDTKNPWAVFDNYIDRVVVRCVNTLTPKWQDKLAAFDVYIWDQCYTMEQSLRLD